MSDTPGRGYRQGSIVKANPEVPLYSYSGLGVDLGEEVALYNYSGLGVDLGNPLEQVADMVDGLPLWAKLFGVGLAALGVWGLVKKVKTKTKTRSNRRRRRKNTQRKARSNGAQTYSAAKPRTNRRRHSKARSNGMKARRNYRRRTKSRGRR